MKEILNWFTYCSPSQFILGLIGIAIVVRIIIEILTGR